MSRIIQLLTQSSWSHAAFYVGDALEGRGADRAEKSLEKIDAPDRRHMLIEADATSGVKAVPLITYRDENIRTCRPFGIWMDSKKERRRFHRPSIESMPLRK